MSRFLVDSILGTVTAAGATLTAATIASGDSLTVKNAKQAFLTGIYVLSQGAGQVRVRSSKLHDSTHGILTNHLTANPVDLMPYRNQRLSAQDPLELHISGSATAGDIEAAVLRVVYVDPDGPNAGNYIGPAELQARTTGNIAVVTGSLTAATAAATYGGSLALNNSSNSYQLRGNTNYALIGISTNTNQAAITVKGPDTGFMRYAIPGNAAHKFYTNGWAVEQSFINKFPLIPVINTANAGTTVIECVNNENAATVVVNLIFEQLAD